MTRITLTNKFDSPITVYTCCINLTLTSILYKKVTEFSTENQTFLLDTSQTSTEFSVDNVYPYMILIYTVDNTTYGAFDLCDCKDAGTECNVVLIDSKTSPDTSVLYGYNYVKIGNKVEVQVPIFLNDITKYIDENNCPADAIKFGNANDDMLPVPTICIDQNVLKTINTSPKPQVKESTYNPKPNSNVQAKISEITDEPKPVTNRQVSLKFSFYFIVLLLIFVGLIWYYLY